MFTKESSNDVYCLTNVFRVIVHGYMKGGLRR